ncbi:TSHZ3 isoform 3 [Pan troglodytes]|uniref:Teashirt zinc finger homeobox 3 n=5 Tax=Homininae TaxID=207598 RepID=U3KQ78_HUMAN|nr:TSHZ3 isoform 3 [Pan troglodytes]
MPRRKQQAPRRAADKSINWVEVLSTWWVENVLP